MRCRLTSFCLVVLALLTWNSARADVTATIVSGDQVVGDLSEAETDRFHVLVASPSSLSIAISTKSGLEVALSLIGPDGENFDAMGSLVKSPGRTPRIIAAQLRTAGTYTVVVSHSIGKGEYRLTVKLAKPRGQKIDLRHPPASSPSTITISAGNVTLDGGTTSLSATTAQGAIEELSNRTDGAEAVLDDYGLRLPPLEGAVVSLTNRLTAVEDVTSNVESRLLTLETSSSHTLGRVTTLEASTTATQDRVVALESAARSSSRALRVYSSLSATQTVAAQFFKFLPATQNDDAYRVSRYKAATVTFAPGAIDEVIVVYLTWTYRPDFAVGVEPTTAIPNSETVWGEIGNKEVWFNSREVSPDPKQDADVLGIDVPTDVIPKTFSWTLVYEPTASERANGFTLDVLLSAWAFGYDKTGFSADIDTAVVLGR